MIIKVITSFITPLLFIIFLQSGVVSAAFFVAPDGVDSNPGTKAKPFASLERARDAVRVNKKRAGASWKGMTVWLRGGHYQLKKTLVLTPEDSGAKGAPVMYAAYPGETPVVSGGSKIKKWSRLTADLSGMTEAAKGRLWVADVPKGDIFHYFFVDGVRQPRAATPNGIESYRNRRVYPQIKKWGPVDPKGQVMTFPKGALKNIPNNGDCEVWLPINNWCFQKVVLRDVNVKASTGRRCSRMPAYHSPRPSGYGYFGFPFRLENALICLDMPGEWCVDTTAGKIYYWPLAGNMDEAEAISARLPNLIHMLGDEKKRAWVSHIEIKGIKFLHADRIPEDKWPRHWIMRNFQNPDAAIRMEGVEHCAVEACTIKDTGSFAIGLYGHAQWNSITANVISYTGSGGISVTGSGAGGPNGNRYNRISRNYIHHPGQTYNKSGAILLINSGDNEVDYNFVYATPYASMQMAGVIRGDWNHKRDPVKEGNSDGYGFYGAMYQFQWDLLPKGWHEAWLAGKGKVGFWDWQKYAYAQKNNWHHNIVVEPETHTTEGGAFYTSDGVGPDNLWKKNLVYKSGGMGESSVFALDGATFNRFTIEDNVVWADKHILEVASVRGNKIDGRPTNSVARNNFRVKPKPGLPTVNSDGSLAPPFKFGPYVKLYREIHSEISKLGGWPGNPPLHILPVVGRPLLCIGTTDGKTEFVGQTEIKIEVYGSYDEIRYTLDGSEPTERSLLYSGPVKITKASTMKAVAYYSPRYPRAPAIQRKRTQEVQIKLNKAREAVEAVASDVVARLKPGIGCAYFDGVTAFGGELGLKKLPVRFNLEEAKKRSVIPEISIASSTSKEDFAFEFSGYIKIETPGLYTFALASDDGSRLLIHGKIVIDHDGIHNAVRGKSGSILLKKGYHPIRLDYFQGTGAAALRLHYSGPKTKNHSVPKEVLFHDARELNIH